MNSLTFLAGSIPVLAILVGILSLLIGGLQFITSGGIVEKVRRSRFIIITGVGLVGVGYIGGVIVLAVLVGILVISVISNKPVALSQMLLVTVIAIALGFITTTLVYSYRRSQRIRASNYSARISELTKSLTKASTEVDRILQEMALAVKDQESIISALKQEHTRLQTEIDILKKAPEADKLFTEYMARLDKKNTKIQWVLFGIGTLIGIASLIVGFISLHH